MILERKGETVYNESLLRWSVMLLSAIVAITASLAYAGEISGSIPPEILQWIGGTTAWVSAKQANEMFVIGYTNVDVGNKEHPVPYRIRNLPAGTYTIRCFGFFFDMMRARYHDMTGIDGKSEIVLGENERIEGISYPDTDIWAKGWDKELRGVERSGWIIIKLKGSLDIGDCELAVTLEQPGTENNPQGRIDWLVFNTPLPPRISFHFIKVGHYILKAYLAPNIGWNSAWMNKGRQLLQGQLSPYLHVDFDMLPSDHPNAWGWYGLCPTDPEELMIDLDYSTWVERETWGQIKHESLRLPTP